MTVSPAADNSKQCAFCGTDCSDRPRVKDGRGRYFCRDCYEAAKTRRTPDQLPHPVERRPSTANAPPPFELPGILDLDDQPSSASPPCPGCGRPLAPSALLCVACGYDKRSATRIAIPPVRAALTERPAPRYLAPLYLAFRPGKFFRDFTSGIHPGIIAMCVWILGMSLVIDNIDLRQGLALAKGKTPTLPDSWALHWAIIAIGGILAGMINLAIGGWWFGLRLRWCGVSNPNTELVRRVYPLAWMVYDIPCVALKAIETASYSSPREAFDESPFWPVFVLAALLFWSVWTSYCGARAVFQAKRALAVGWFLVVPGAWFGLTLGASFFAGMLLTSGALTPSPELARSQSFTQGAAFFQYPGNWSIDRQDPEYDPAGSISITASLNAFARVMVFESEEPLEFELDGTADGFQYGSGATDFRLVSEEAPAGWTLARTYAVAIEGEPVFFRVLITQPRPGWCVELHEFRLEAERERLRPGFALIERTLQLRR